MAFRSRFPGPPCRDLVTLREVHHQESILGGMPSLLPESNMRGWQQSPLVQATVTRDREVRMAKIVAEVSGTSHTDSY